MSLGRRLTGFVAMVLTADAEVGCWQGHKDQWMQAAAKRKSDKKNLWDNGINMMNVSASQLQLAGR